MLNSWPQRERIVLAASRSLMGKGIRNDKEKFRTIEPKILYFGTPVTKRELGTFRAEV